MGELLNYFGELTKAMTLCAKSGAVIVGQSVEFDGQAMYQTFSGVPVEQRIEFPVAEDFQMGFCTGLSLSGVLPVCVYPRFDFLLLAVNQLVNHLDKFPFMSGYKPKVIIRTAVGSTFPLNPGPQHCQNHSAAFEDMCKSVRVVRLEESGDIVPAYSEALRSDVSTLLVEYASDYHR